MQSGRNLNTQQGENPGSASHPASPYTWALPFRKIYDKRPLTPHSLPKGRGPEILCVVIFFPSSLRTPWEQVKPRWGPAPPGVSTTHTLPKSVSHASLASLFPVLREPPVALVPGSRAQALAMDVTRYSSSALRQPHQLISGWLQRAMAAPLRRCLTEQKNPSSSWHSQPPEAYH